MATSSKAIKLAAELADELRKRVSDYVITEGFDASGFPTISLTADATPATTEDNVFIRVRPRDWALATDVLGTAQTVYTPSVIQIIALRRPRSARMPAIGIVAAKNRIANSCITRNSLRV